MWNVCAGSCRGMGALKHWQLFPGAEWWMEGLGFGCGGYMGMCTSFTPLGSAGRMDGQRGSFSSYSI